MGIHLFQEFLRNDVADDGKALLGVLRRSLLQNTIAEWVHASAPFQVFRVLHALRNGLYARRGHDGETADQRESEH
jgi:hypothetical protein